MGSMAEHKLHLIQQISVIDNPNELEAFLEKELEEIKAKKVKNGENKAKTASPKKDKSLTYKDLEERAKGKPIMKKFDVEAIMREQGWKGYHDTEKMKRLVKEMNIKEPIEDLLAMLTP